MDLYHLSASVLIILPMLFAVGDGETFYAETGTCEHITTGEQRCALLPSDCEPSHVDGEKNVVGGERWYNAYRMKQRGVNPCTCETTPVGACFVGGAGLDGSGGIAALEFRCAPHPESCVSSRGETFGEFGDIPLEDGAECGCSVLGVLEEWDADDDYDEDDAVELPPAQSATLFGACYNDENDHFCAFSPSDCKGGDEGYSWMDPASVKDLLGYDCTCADTHIGGCVGGFMGFACAVTSEDCSWDSYYPPRSLKKTHGYSCRLCKPIENRMIKADAIDALTLEKSVAPGDASNAKTIAGTIGGAIGVFAGIAITLISVFVCKKRGGTASNQSDKQSNRVFT